MRGIDLYVKILYQAAATVLYQNVRRAHRIARDVNYAMKEQDDHGAEINA